MLIFVSKVFQNLANGVRFGDKEPRMAVCNAFLDLEQARVHRAFQSLCVWRGYHARLLFIFSLVL